MIRSRLSVLMAERNERQDDLSRATGISKATLSNIANNKTAGIQYEILESLAMYFDISIGDLFEYSPFNIEFEQTVEFIEKNMPNNMEQQEYIDEGQELGEISFDFYMGSMYTITGAQLRKTTGDLFMELVSDSSEISDPLVADDYTGILKVSFGIPYPAFNLYNRVSTVTKINELSSAFKKQVVDDFHDFLKENYAYVFKSDGLTGNILVIFGSTKYQFILDLSDN